MKSALVHLRSADPVLSGIIEKVGPYRISYREPDFETLVRSIVYQQISGKAALTVLAKVHAAFGTPLHPEAIVGQPVARLRACGLSGQKTSYIRDLAQHTLDGRLDFAALAGKTDEEVIEILTDVRGIGIWTAQMFLMFALRRANVLPVGDLGVQNAIRKAYGKRRKVTPKQVARIAKPWHPYCSVASWYLWRSLDGPAEI